MRTSALIVILTLFSGLGLGQDNPPENPKPQASDKPVVWKVIEVEKSQPHRNWIYRHPVAFMLISAGVGGTVGGVIAHYQSQLCPNYVIYEGRRFPYQGTKPCPGPNYDPGGKRR